jgi:hypothetical protein
MDRRPDDRSTAERSSDVLLLMREEEPEVKSFPEADPGRKPLAPFDALPLHAAPPRTWGARS